MNRLTKIADLNPDLLEQILAMASAYRDKHRAGSRRENKLNGKVVAMVFEKPSLRTKVAFEVAATSLGGNPVFLSSNQILASGGNQQGRESIPDIARNLERFCDLIIARVYSHQVIEEIGSSIETPIINALCDLHHPTQALADLMLIRQRFGKEKVKVAYVGDGNNVATSLAQICAMAGNDVALASPSGYQVPERQQAVADSYARERGAVVDWTDVPEQAVQNAHVVYTDTHVSMGMEEEKEQRKKAFKRYQVNAVLMKRAQPGAIFMHCLPAHRGEEVTDEVMDSGQSAVFDQAECRLHIAKALLSLMLG